MAGSSPKQLYVSESSNYSGISFVNEEWEKLINLAKINLNFIAKTFFLSFNQNYISWTLNVGDCLT